MARAKQDDPRRSPARAAPRRMRVARPASSARLQAQRNRVADFLPVFESERFKFGVWTPMEKQEDGSFHLPWFNLSAQGERFVEILHDLGEALPGSELGEEPQDERHVT